MRSNINIRANANGFGIAQIRNAAADRDALRGWASLCAFWLGRLWESMAVAVATSKRKPLLVKAVPAVVVSHVALHQRTSRTTTTRPAGYPRPWGTVSIS